MNALSITVQGPSTFTELVISLDQSLDAFQNRLSTLTGVPVASQIVTIDEAPLVACSSLHDLNLHDGSCVIVTTNDLALKTSLERFSDLSQVEKWEMTDTDYASRRDTVMAYKQRNKIGRFGDNVPSEQPDIIIPVGAVVGARCEEVVTERRGCVKYVGEVEGLPNSGLWVGVEFDEPAGSSSDGMAGNKKVFECAKGRGRFLRPDKLLYGNQYTEVDDLDWD